MFDERGQLVKDATQLKAGEELSARLARGRVRARVTVADSGAPESGELDLGALH